LETWKIWGETLFIGIHLLMNTLHRFSLRKAYCKEVKERLAAAKKGTGLTGMAVVARPEPPLAAPIPPDLSSPPSSWPAEVWAEVFSMLDDPRDLLAAAAVCRAWRALAMQSRQWRRLSPVRWSRNQWSYSQASKPSDVSLKTMMETSAPASRSSSSENLSEELSLEQISAFAATTRREMYVFAGVIHNLLPIVGRHVRALDLSCSRGVTSAQANAILRLTPEARTLDLSYTSAGAGLFRDLAREGTLRKLEEIDLEGCKNVNDETLDDLRKCFSLSVQKRKTQGRSQLRRLNLSGCYNFTSYGLALLEAHRSSLEELDLSGCYKIDGETLSLFVEGCPKLKPNKLSYCNDIEDGPWPREANGCQNLECAARFCCQQLKN